MATIYEKDTNGLVATGDRVLTTFESGLVRVDRTYVCTNDSAAINQLLLSNGAIPPQDDGFGAVDGLFIFPEPQPIRKPEGFSEFKVSSYGRWTTGYVDERRFGQADFTYYPSTPPNVFDNYVPDALFSEYIIRRFVKKKTEDLSFGTSGLADQFLFFLENGDAFNPYIFPRTVVNLVISDPVVRSYGEIDEWEVIIKPRVEIYGFTD